MVIDSMETMPANLEDKSLANCAENSSVIFNTCPGHSKTERRGSIGQVICSSFRFLL